MPRTPPPRRATAPAVGRSATAQELFRAVVAAAVEHYEGNVAGLLASGDPEYVHQARVALRR
ncbi:MAG: CHAD domain-containing protein, partial [Deltaproteobacteria bacterium]|nr:CHAD domain-containing protein [Deltaproteobacteria bacterium]